MAWAIYILLCDQKMFYVGLSSNVDKRFISHKLKENLATKEFSEIQLVYSELYPTRKEAEQRERQLKGWSVAKKKALISGDKSLLIKLSKTRSLLKNDE
jgi:predicted GIY-YIG superfamily endonuclease